MAAKSVPAEQAVLGGLMLDASRFAEVDLIPEDFTRPDHQEIFRAILRCIEKRTPTDAVTVSEVLDSGIKDKRETWLPYCVGLVKETPSSHNVKHYAAIVKAHSTRAKAKVIASNLIEDIDHDEEALDNAMKSFMRLNMNARQYDGTIADAVGEVIDELDYRAQHPKEQLLGMSTGLTRVDKATNGLNKGHLIVIAGRPGMGKTAMMGGIHLANRNKPTAIMSAEMPKRELAMRMVASVAGVCYSDLRGGRISDAMWPKITEAINFVKSLPIHINDKSAPTIEEIARQARRWKYEHDIQLLSIDYLQRLPTPGGLSKRNEGVEYIVRMTKEIARELEIPVVALSAVSREVEKRQDKRPVMSDLRDSAAIEAEADLIITQYRPEVYSDDSSLVGVAELALIKNRHGALAKCTVHYDGPTVTFSDYGIEGGAAGSDSFQGRDGDAQRGLDLGQRSNYRAAYRGRARGAGESV